MKIFKNSVALSALVLITCIAPAAAEPLAPDAVVKNTATEVLELIKNDGEIQSGDVPKISQVVEDKVLPHFDLERMAHTSIGGHWDKSSKEQQAQFLQEFHKFVARSFIIVLSQYHGQPINFEPARTISTDHNAIVRTKILESDGDSETIDFMLERKENVWIVYDVIAEGISFVSNYHSQFSNPLVQNGIDFLIEKLVEKNKQPLSIQTLASRKHS